jgi:hypothetical protein
MSRMQTDDRGTLLAVPTERQETHGLLPDPPQQKIHYTVISVNDHLVEPPTMFEGRLPRKLQDGAPKLMTQPSGDQAWVFDGKTYLQVGLNAIAGRPREDLGPDASKGRSQSHRWRESDSGTGVTTSTFQFL